MTDIWGWCAHCQRWFDCPGWFDPELPEPMCPRCGGAATAICNRAAYRVVVGRVA